MTFPAAVTRVTTAIEQQTEGLIVPVAMDMHDSRKAGG